MLCSPTLSAQQQSMRRSDSTRSRSTRLGGSQPRRSCICCPLPLPSLPSLPPHCRRDQSKITSQHMGTGAGKATPVKLASPQQSKSRRSGSRLGCGSPVPKACRSKSRRRWHSGRALCPSFTLIQAFAKHHKQWNHAIGAVSEHDARASGAATSTRRAPAYSSSSSIA